jgi:hypothetical protein
VFGLRLVRLAEVAQLTCVNRDAPSFDFDFYYVDPRAICVPINLEDLAASYLARCWLRSDKKYWVVEVEVVGVEFHGVFGLGCFFPFWYMQIYIHIYIRSKLFFIFFSAFLRCKRTL